MFNKSCWWLDSNPGFLVLEATALPTASQPLPIPSLCSAGATILAIVTTVIPMKAPDRAWGWPRQVSIVVFNPSYNPFWLALFCIVITSFDITCVIISGVVLKNGPIPASFCLFSFFSYNFNTNWKKRRWCAWDLNPGPQEKVVLLL